MNPADAETLAYDLMTEFGLTADGWGFQFDSARKRFGACKRSRCGRIRQITLSRALTVANDRVAVEDTLRHEIAHALAPMGAGHGYLWREQCAVTGARPEQCYGAEVVPAAGTWSFTCEACGASGRRTRKPSASILASGYHCRGAALRWERA